MRPTPAEDGRSRLQGRLAWFARSVFVLTTCKDVVELFQTGGVRLTSGWVLEHVVTVIMIGVWAACRGRLRSLRILRLIDAAMVFAVAMAVSLMGRYLAPELSASHGGGEISQPTMDAYASMVSLLGGTVLFTFRAAVIPSSPQVTLAVTGFLGSPFVVTPLIVTPAWEGALHLRPATLGGLVDHGLWWLIITAICGMISATIYGLEKEVAEVRQCGPYRLEEKLGEGSMGVVYRASHARLRRPTAVKLLRPDRQGESELRRFELEAQLTSRLTHPNTVTVFDYGRTLDGHLYYAMELLEGRSLQDVVDDRGPLALETALRLIEQLAGSLAEAHTLGLVHRDVKPSNIMVGSRGLEHASATLCDFGLARFQRGEAGLTAAGRLVGTPHYLAPELIRGDGEASPSSDVYALGAVAAFMLTGREPFAGESLVEVCAQHLHAVPRPFGPEHAVPVTIDLLVRACLAKDPERRPSTQTVRAVLRRCAGLARRRAKGRRARTVAGGELSLPRRRGRRHAA